MYPWERCLAGSQVDSISLRTFRILRSSQKPIKKEDDMNALEAITAFSQILGALGLFFTGVGVLWFVTVYKEKKE